MNRRSLFVLVAAMLAVTPVAAQVTLREPGATATKNGGPPAQKSGTRGVAPAATPRGPVGRYLDTARLAPGAVRESRNPIVSGVGGIAWDPTGRYLLQFDSSPLFGGRVIVLNAGSFAQVREHRTHRGSVQSAVFSRDGRVALTASGDKTAQIWNVVTGEVEKSFAGHTKMVKTAYFSADPGQSKVLTASQDGNAMLWDRTTGQALGTFAGNARVQLIAAFFVGDGHRVVTVSADGSVRTWDMGTFATQTTTQVAPRNIIFADISPDGYTLLTSSNDHNIRTTDLRTGETRVLATEQSSSIVPAKVRFSPDGKLIGVSSTGTILVLSAEDGAPLDRFNPPNPPPATGFLGALTQAPLEFTFAVDSITLIIGPVPYADATGAASSIARYVEWRPEL